MALKMAQPWRDPKSHVWNLRQRTPADLLDKLKGKTVMLPVGEGFATVKVGAMVQASLRTSDPRTAKERHAKVDAALRQFWDGHRTGPKRLTHKEAAALAGTLYADFARIEDDPGSPELWISAAEGNMAARLGTSTLIIGDPALAASVARRDRFGAFADLLLAREGLVVDADTCDVVHGHQQLSLFNAHYDERCFLPIHIYDIRGGPRRSTGCGTFGTTSRPKAATSSRPRATTSARPATGRAD